MGAQTSGAAVESLIVVDTDIFIDHFRGVQSASEYLQNIPNSIKLPQNISKPVMLDSGSRGRRFEYDQAYQANNPVIERIHRVLLFKVYTIGWYGSYCKF